MPTTYLTDAQGQYYKDRAGNKIYTSQAYKGQTVTQGWRFTQPGGNDVHTVYYNPDDPKQFFSLSQNEYNSGGSALEGIRSLLAGRAGSGINPYRVDPGQAGGYITAAQKAYTEAQAAANKALQQQGQTSFVTPPPNGPGYVDLRNQPKVPTEQRIADQDTRIQAQNLAKRSGTNRLAGESVNDFVQRLSGGSGTAQANAGQVVGSSASLRARQSSQQLLDSLGLGAYPTAGLSRNDQSTLDLARRERDQSNAELATILDQRMKLQSGFQQFAQGAGSGVSEAARAGVTSEEGRKVQAQLDALDRRELVLETKLKNRQTVISELMDQEQQDYANAVSRYNAQFSQALQLYGLFDKQQDELRTSAKASLDVLSKSLQAQIEAGTVQPGAIPAAKRSQIEEMELQAGLPVGSTLGVLQTLKPGEEKLYSGVDDYGTFVYITKDAQGQIQTRKVPGAVPQRQPKGTTGSGAGTAPASSKNSVLSKVGLPLTLGSSTGKLQAANLEKLRQAGLPLDVAEGIWKNVLAGNPLEEIRQGLAAEYGREQGYQFLDKFMSTLQGGNARTT